MWRGSLLLAVLMQVLVTVASADPAQAAEFPQITFKLGNSEAFATSLARADVNGDGRNDYVLGNVYNYDEHSGAGTPPTHSSAFVVFDSPSLPQVVDLNSLGSNGFAISNSELNRFVGRKVANAGDINGDGRDDIVLTTEIANQSRDDAQKAYLLWGQANSPSIDLTTLGASQGVEFDSPQTGGYVSFSSAAALGDVNGDGRPDIAFSDSIYGDGRGRMHIVYGHSSWPQTMNLDTLAQDGNGYNITGTPGVPFGATVAAVGDVNGDSFSDIVASAGYSYLVFFGGSSLTDIQGVSTSNIGQRGFPILCGCSVGQAGLPEAAVGVGDVNGDGLSDIVATAAVGGGDISWMVYVVFGKTDSSGVTLGGSGTSPITASSVSNNFGFALARNATSLIVSEPYTPGPNGEEDAGRAYSFQLSSLATPHALSDPEVHTVQGGDAGKMRLGLRLGGGADNLFLAVHSPTAGYVAAVVPDSNLTVSLPPANLPAPTGLEAASPTNSPVLGWVTVAGADHYNVYRDGTNIGYTSVTSFTDAAAPEGGHTYTVTAVDTLAAESAQSSPVNVLVDKTAPAVSASAKTADGGDYSSGTWTNQTVTVHFTCTDALSGVASCEGDRVLSADTVAAGVDVVGAVTDNAGNTASSAPINVKIDKTGPAVGTLSWTANPLLQGQSTTLSATATDGLSGVSKVEYSVDGGARQAMAFDSASGTWKATLGHNPDGSSLAVNTYNIDVFATDAAGNESAGKMDVLAVYNAANGYVTGHDKLTPSATDTLPIALDTSNQPAQVVLGFTNVTAPTSGSFDVHYVVKNNQDEFDLASTAVDWLVVPDSTHASILGHANMDKYVGGVHTTLQNVAVRFDIVLGTNGAPDHVSIKIYQPGVDPNTGTPSWVISDNADLSQVMIHP